MSNKYINSYTRYAHSDATNLLFIIYASVLIELYFHWMSTAYC